MVLATDNMGTYFDIAVLRQAAARIGSAMAEIAYQVFRAGVDAIAIYPSSEQRACGLS